MLQRAMRTFSNAGDVTKMAHLKPASGRPGARPLSPHLQIYSPLINMVMSIVHRITGAALYFGTLLLAAWLIAAASGPSAFEAINWLFGSWLGYLVLIGYTWALILHMMGGIRHLIWDTGRGMDLKTVDRFAWGSLILSMLVTAGIWLAALAARGVF
jgi:succinate dehydrogenase / fumarate reductase, cytochrome b subunit